MKNITQLMTMLSIAALLAGCSENTSNNAKVHQINPNTNITAAIDPTAVVKQKTTYEASLSEGIDFKREGYPTFVAKTTGISEKESFGRWSDGDEVIIDLVVALPDKFNILLQAAAFGPNINKPFIMIIGDSRQEFKVDTGSPEIMKDILIPFQIIGEIKSIRIVVPQATSPKAVANSPDERRLGIALGRLQIKE